MTRIKLSSECTDLIGTDILISEWAYVKTGAWHTSRIFKTLSPSLLQESTVMNYTQQNNENGMANISARFSLIKGFICIMNFLSRMSKEEVLW